MRWKVDGANATTGKNESAIVEADTESEAIREARKKGVMAAGVHAVAAHEPKHEHQPVKAPPDPPKPEKDRYPGLTFGATVLNILAFFYYLAAGVVFVGGFVATTGPWDRAEAHPVMIGLLLSLGLATTGLILHISASACEALHDIAINSWKRLA